MNVNLVEVQQLCQEWLSGHEEERAWLRGNVGAEWIRSHEMLRNRVCRILSERHRLDWPAMQPAVVDYVRRVCEAMRGGGGD